MSFSLPTTFNDFIGRENLEMEFKEFSLYNSGLNLTYSHAEKLCHTGQFDFNCYVIQNIKRYTINYLPRYTCAFLNREIRCAYILKQTDEHFIARSGHLFIGVNNYGFARGIPYQGELPTDKIKEVMLSIITKRVKNKSIKDINFKNLVNIQIFKIDSPPKPSTEISPSFAKYLKQKEDFIKEYNQFIEKIENWKIRENFFTQKLVNLVNNTESRLMLIEYIRNTEPTSPIIKLLESNYILEYKNHEEISTLKDDVMNPYYWVCRWKDEMLDIIRARKPVFNDPGFMACIPYYLIISASEMIPWWVHKNPNMNLYIIHIEFKTLLSEYGVSSLDEYFLYKNDKNWKSCYRNILPNGEPTCTPLI